MPEVSDVGCDRTLESLRADQLERWHRGERRFVESYHATAPDLLANPEALLDLIYNEVVVRDELGEAPQLDEYLRRFPLHADALRRQFTVHRLLDSPSLRSSAPTPVPSTVPALGDVPAARTGSLGDRPLVPGYEIEAELGAGPPEKAGRKKGGAG